MGVTGPPGPVMDRDEADRALARLGAEHKAVEDSLLALQDHAGRRLLEGAALTGTTRERWAAAERTIALLWTYFDAYTDALRAAHEVRSRRRTPGSGELAELSGWLRAECVTVPAAPAPGGAAGAEPSGGADPEPDGAPPQFPPPGGMTPDGAEPDRAEPGGGGAVGGSGGPVERFTLDRLVTRINELYARSLDVVVTAEAVWSALPARIDLLAAELNRTRSLARSVGVRPGEHPAGDDLEAITEELTALRAQVISDPLAFWRRPAGSSAPGGGRPDTDRYDRAARALEDVRREIEAVLQVRQDSESRLLRLRDLLSRADRTLAEARTARVEVLSKIAATEVPVVSGPPTALHERLAMAAEYRRHAQWHRLSPLLEALEREAEDELLRARESLTAVTAPLAVRAELRGRLDAYRARVARHGLADDAFLGERYDAARRMLWSAPCDLRAAERAVLRYQRAASELLSTGGGA
ncbi:MULTISPECIES: hypothetical protein [Streptomyces]|uniref:Uncharacterized protein n=2 Tax=Streptomyces TaxID=1883 RepID=A0A117IU78_9ACTN|nr:MULTISPECIES: hypothetical protein [Streptomyces]KUH35390.1 hypothetical protein ATE80_29445 [Streptomyces kanasensis]UUS31079.1 hypothetical protein NRO40_09675 [Streptomyces changanensis]